MRSHSGALQVEVIEDERRTFCDSRAKEKLQLQEVRIAAKRKFDADLEAQRAYNRNVKGEGRKKFKEALDATPTPMNANEAGPSSATMAPFASAARARFPKTLSDYYEEERLASLVDALIGTILLSD